MGWVRSCRTKMVVAGRRSGFWCGYRFSGFQICLDERSHYGLVYKGWVDKTTYTPFKDNTGLPIVVKKLPYNHKMVRR
ncbi:hypothetical protein HanPSC8_Chr11g0485331 [Helianthus annuus]|nr:hypothetical protein HanPSC8_Chr11g0485331 [Helianthus annuus]